MSHQLLEPHAPPSASTRLGWVKSSTSPHRRRRSLGGTQEKISRQVRASSRIRDRRLYWEDVHRKRAEEERARQEREERERRLEAELQGLLKVVDLWRKTRDIRSLVRAVVPRAEQTDVELTPSTQLREWADWASWHADRIDPLLAEARAKESMQSPAQ